MPVHTLLGSWATRRRGQMGMVEGGERGGGRHPRPSPSSDQPKEQILCLETLK